jgi:acyl-[acyl-carrier-protein] desaturase
MHLDHRVTLTPDQRRHLDTVDEVLVAIEPAVAELVATHRRTSRRWHPHEVVPWGQGRDFTEQPWRPSDCTMAPDIVIALETNLLTEDNLPYYHANIERMTGTTGVWREWNRLWTAEEHKHGEALRSYLHLMRVMDPGLLEDHRHHTMEVGFDRDFTDPLELFAYTSAQELATRVSHQRTGQRADEPIIAKLLTLIARDENFHYLFYRGVVKAVLEIAPDLMLPALARQLYTFAMPGTGMSDFELRQATIANAGIYGAREHRELVIAPLLAFLGVDALTGLSSAGTKAQERIVRLDAVLARLVDRQDRLLRKSEAAAPVRAVA